MVPALAAVAALAALVAAALFRRRGRGGAGLLARSDAPPGLKHLAATVLDLSDLGLHLPSAPPPGRRSRLGALLALR